jgi:BT1 family
MANAVLRWLDRNVLELGRELRLDYLPPLMVYVAAGISGLTGIVGTFFIKEYLGLSAEFLAALGFWAGIPWALKMPVGHLVDLIWRWKNLLVYLGAGLIALSLLIMYALIAHTAQMRAVLPAGHWFVISTLLAPVGYVVQDVVADAMTVEAVPRVDARGRAFDPDARKLMHTTMQTLGRVAIIGGSVLVALANVWLFRNGETMSTQDKADTYALVYLLALGIPLCSVLGTALATLLHWRRRRRLASEGFTAVQIAQMLAVRSGATQPNWWILGASLLFVAITLSVGLADLPYGQELVFAGSMTVVLFLMWRLLQTLGPEGRRTLIGTAAVIFVFRAMPGPGAGSTWWMIDALGFDQSFLAKLSLIASVLTLAGMFIFRRFMAERSIAYVVGFLTVAGTLLSLPIIGMYYGLHEWTADLTGGLVNARTIALIDTALESPLGQIAMIPMLAWIANSAPADLKATFFAVMASFTNLALSASQLGTKYLNQLFTVTREVRDSATQAITVPADYSELGWLLMAATVIGFALPMLAILTVRVFRLRTA